MHDNESIKDDVVNGRTASINIPGDVMMSPSSKSPKSPSSTTPNMVENRNSLRHQQEVVGIGGNVSGVREKEHREHVNGAKVGNHYNNNSKVNSACLNNLILPLLSEVSFLHLFVSHCDCFYSFILFLIIKLH